MRQALKSVRLSHLILRCRYFYDPALQIRRLRLREVKLLGQGPQLVVAKPAVRFWSSYLQPLGYAAAAYITYNLCIFFT